MEKRNLDNLLNEFYKDGNEEAERLYLDKMHNI